MFSKVLIVFIVVFFSQDINCILTKLDVENQYKPTLVRLRSVTDAKYTETTNEYNVLVNQLKNQQDRAKNATQTHINNIKVIIAGAGKSANITAATMKCLNVQQNAVNRLSTTSINNCYSSGNTSLLVNTKSKFSTLGYVALNSVAWCTSLNPLPTQIESYIKCLSDKVQDLNWQINIVGNEYNELSNATLHYNINCLTDKAGTILGQISLISYEINICFIAQ